MPDDYKDLDTFGDGFTGERKFAMKLEELPVGEYEFRLDWANLNIATNGDRVCNFRLVSPVNGLQVDRTYWLTRVEEVNKLTCDLRALGVDTRGWATPQKPLSRMIPAALLQVRGKQFRCIKSENENKTTHQVYHDLYIGSVVVPGKPAPVPPPRQPDELDAPRQGPPPASQHCPF